MVAKVRSLTLQLYGFEDTSYEWHEGSCWRSAYPTAALLSTITALKDLTILLSLPFEADYLRSLRRGLLDPVWLQVGRFKYLRTLKTNFLPPSQVLKIPSLKTLHLDFAFGNRPHHLDTFEPINNEELEPTSTVSNVILAMDDDFLHSDPNLQIQRRVSRLLVSLENIDSLQFRFRSSFRPFPRYFRGFRGIYYSGIMDFLTGQQNIKTLSIGTCDFCWDEMTACIDLVDESPDTWISKRQHALTIGNPNVLPGSKSMRRIILPQEALFGGIKYMSSHSVTLLIDFHVVHLPDAIESIEVIDSTRALNRWAQYVLDHPEEYPHLKTIVLWCDRHTEPLVDDARVRPAGELCQDCKRNDPYWDSKLDVDLSDKVWNDMKKAGISVVVNTERTQGWRDI